MKITEENGALVLFPAGRIDSTNADEFSRALNEAAQARPDAALILDAEALEYISSAGLRVLLKLRQSGGRELAVRNASPAVFEIFEVTGFSSFLKVEKALRFVSVRGLELVGTGAHSAVYRLDGDTLIKVVQDMTLEAIRAEMQVAKKALIHGIPTSISYDVVRTEDGFGEVFEMIDADSLPAAVRTHPDQIDQYLRRFVDMYRSIHSITIDENELESVRDRFLAATDRLAPYVAVEELELIRKLLRAIPERHTFVHGDFHMGNVMLQEGELVLIDMGEAGWGHPLLDFAQTSLAYTNVTTLRPQNCRKVLGMELEQAVYIRDHIFPLYFGEDDPALARKLEGVAAVAELRRLLIWVLQGWDHLPEEFDAVLARVRANIFPRADEICGIFQNDF